MYSEIEGDLLDLFQKKQFNILVHGCNCHNVMGAGIALQIAKQYPVAQEADNLTRKGDPNKLGTISVAKVDHDQMIVNAYTQFDTINQQQRDRGVVAFCYPAFGTILVKLLYFPQDLKFAFPLIGCGLAGATEKKVTDILKTWANTHERDVTVVRYKKGI